MSGVAEIQVKIVDDDEPAGGGLSAGQVSSHERGGGNDSKRAGVPHVDLDGGARQPAWRFGRQQTLPAGC